MQKLAAKTAVDEDNRKKVNNIKDTTSKLAFIDQCAYQLPAEMHAKPAKQERRKEKEKDRRRRLNKPNEVRDG